MAYRHLTSSILSPNQFESTESLVVYGPQGCGKSRNSIAIANAFGLRKILDNWTRGDEIPKHDTLILTSDDLDSAPKLKVNAISFREAMKRARLKERTV